MIYLASPCSHPEPALREQRFQSASAAAACMISAGEVVFPPIIHGHPLVEQWLPTDWSFWQRVGGDHLLFCDEVVVLMLDGWDRSVGVREEVRLATALGKPVRYVAPISTEPRAVSPTLAHVAAGPEESNVGLTNERTPHVGERGASGRSRTLTGCSCISAAYRARRPSMKPVADEMRQTPRIAAPAVRNE